MADMLVLPTRATVGEHLAGLLRPLLPGVPIAPDECVAFLEHLAQQHRLPTVLVFAEDIPTHCTLPEALRDGFGATATDRIVTVALEKATNRDEPRVGPFASVLPTIGSSYTTSTN